METQIDFQLPLMYSFSQDPFLPFHCFFPHQLFLVIQNTLLKLNDLYWHRWLRKELLKSMEPFHCTKGSLQWKKGSLDY